MNDAFPATAGRVGPIGADSTAVFPPTAVNTMPEPAALRKSRRIVIGILRHVEHVGR
jgi:hypothetical protein